MNVPLRVALLRSPIRTQIRLAALTGIREERLSRIVNGWVTATPAERAAIAHAVERPENELFGASGGSAAA